jgi:integrase
MNVDRSLVLSKKIAKGDKYFPKEIVEKLYSLIPHIRDKTYLMFHIETGLRIRDVLGCEFVHVDWDLNRIYCYDFKKDKWRYVYYPPKVKAALKIWLRHRESIGIKDKRIFPFSAKTANRIVKKRTAEVGFRFAAVAGTHWCRHTFIRLSRKAGRDLKFVQQNTGDTVKTILEWYSDLSTDDLIVEVSKPLI